MKINIGIIRLDPIYEFVKNNKEIPHRTKDKEIYIEYRKQVLTIISSVPEEPGWYIWFDKSKSKIIYIGKSSKGKTSHLKARIKEELLEEYVAFWLAIDDGAAKLLFEKYEKKYNQERAARKERTDTILWIAYPKVKDGALDVIEQKLIQELEPTANRDKRDYSDIHVDIYDEIIEKLNHYAEFTLFDKNTDNKF